MEFLDHMGQNHPLNPKRSIHVLTYRGPPKLFQAKKKPKPNHFDLLILAAALFLPANNWHQIEIGPLYNPSCTYWKFPPGPGEANAAPTCLPFAWVCLQELQPHLWWLSGGPKRTRAPRARGLKADRVLCHGPAQAPGCRETGCKGTPHLRCTVKRRHEHPARCTAQEWEKSTFWFPVFPLDSKDPFCLQQNNCPLISPLQTSINQVFAGCSTILAFARQVPGGHQRTDPAWTSLCRRIKFAVGCWGSALPVLKRLSQLRHPPLTLVFAAWTNAHCKQWFFSLVEKSKGESLIAGEKRNYRITHIPTLLICTLTPLIHCNIKCQDISFDVNMLRALKASFPWIWVECHDSNGFKLEDLD